MLFVGKKATDRLKEEDLLTMGEIASAGVDRMTALLGKTGETIWNYSMGLDATPVLKRTGREAPKSIGNGTTFARDLVGARDICAGLLMLCDQVGTRLRKHGLFCRTVQVQIRDPNFKTISRQQSLPSPTNVTKEIYEAAVAVVSRAWSMSAPVRMLTVTAENLTDSCTEQMRLVEDDTDRRLKNVRLDQAVDTIRARFGGGAISFGSTVKGIKEEEEETQWM